MAIIGIDQSLTGTGIAEISNEGKLIRTKLLRPGKALGVQRLDFITQSICEFCEDVKEKFVIAREGYSFSSKGRSVFNLGELGGCIDLTLYRSSISNLFEYFIFPPTVVKKLCLGSGAVKKDTLYLLEVLKKTGIEFPDDNQADAYMIAMTLWHFKKAICVKQGIEYSNFVNSLSDIKKEALLSALMSAKSKEGVTKASIKKMSVENFSVNVLKVIEQYKVFSRC